jgi:hypothetical protein
MSSTQPIKAPTASTVLLPALSLRLCKLLQDAVLAGGFCPGASARLTLPRDLNKDQADGITLTLVGLHHSAGVRNTPVRSRLAASPQATWVESHYVVTAWSTQIAMQQWMLATALRQLSNQIVVTARELAHPFTPGADLGCDPRTGFRLSVTSLTTDQVSALLVPALPPSLLLVAGSIELT